MKVTIQYTRAVLLIVSSIALAFYQVMHIDDIAGGVLIYIAQAFLLAASIFGLSYYINIIRNYANEKTKGDTERTAQ